MRIAQVVEEALSELQKNDCPAFFEKWDSIWNDDGTSDVFLYQEYSGSGSPDIQLLGGAPAAQGNYKQWLSENVEAMHFAGSPAANESKQADGLGNWMITCRKAIYRAMVPSCP